MILKFLYLKSRREGEKKTRQRDRLLQYVTFDVGVFNISEIAN